MGQVEDEIRIDAEDALAAIDGLEVRRVFSGWGFYRHDLLFAAAGEGELRITAGRKAAYPGRERLHDALSSDTPDTGIILMGAICRHGIDGCVASRSSGST